MVGSTHIAHSCLKVNNSKVCFVSVFRYDGKIGMEYNWVAMNMRTSGKWKTFYEGEGRENDKVRFKKTKQRKKIRGL